MKNRTPSETSGAKCGFEGKTYSCLNSLEEKQVKQMEKSETYSTLPLALLSQGKVFLLSCPLSAIFSLDT